MANKMSFGIQGLEEIGKSLQGIEKRIRLEAEDNALKAGSKIIVKEAKRLAPVRTSGNAKTKKGKPRKPGRLRRSIGFKVRTAGGFFSTAGGKVRSFSVISSKDPLAHLIEYGHDTKLGKTYSKNSRRKSKGTVSHIGPKPFFRPALDTTNAEVLSVMADEIKKVLFK